MSELDGDLRVVFRGERMLALEKPPGLLSVPGKGAGKEDCAVARARAWCAREGVAASGPMVVHRLDMDTSGVMVLALDADAQRDLSGQFERREVEKRYIALVEGVVARDEGEIDAALRLEPEARPFQVFDLERGQPAQTRWRVMAREVDRTRVEFTPRTGRTHQLRVHAALRAPIGLGHAIVGDVLYGAEGLEQFRRLTGREWQPIGASGRAGEGREGGREERSGASSPHPALSHRPEGDGRGGKTRLMLHASWLRVREPGGGKWVEVESRAPF